MNISSWNIRNRRNGGLYSAARALNEFGNVDIAVIQEIKFTKKEIKYTTKNYLAYRIRTAQDTRITPAGGVLLLYWEDKSTMPYRVKNNLVVAPNIITFELVTGERNDGLLSDVTSPHVNGGMGAGQPRKRRSSCSRTAPGTHYP